MFRFEKGGESHDLSLSSLQVGGYLSCNGAHHALMLNCGLSLHFGNKKMQEQFAGTILQSFKSTK